MYGVGLGIVDASSNMQAVAVEHRYRRPILPSFHGAWTFGGLSAPATHSPPRTCPCGPRPRGGGAARGPLRAVLAREHGEALAEAQQADVPWRPILLVGLGMVLFYMVDTAAPDLGPIYLDDVVDAPPSLVALATLPYLVASLALRLAGTPWWRGTAPRWSSGSARRRRLALLVVVTAPTWPVAVLGFTLLGAGVSVIAPLSFSAAARIAGGERGPRGRGDRPVQPVQLRRRAARCGTHRPGRAGSLRLGFAIPMVLILAMLPLARAFAPAGAVDPQTRSAVG